MKNQIKITVFTLLFVMFSFLSIVNKSFAQEISFTVRINDQQLQTNQSAEKQVIVTLQRTLNEFLNARRWTQDNLRPEEKISCTFEITLTKADIPQGIYEATAQIRATRPVYNTNYETLIFLFIDRKFNFQYLPAQPIDFNENVFFSNLSSMLGYYAYIILAMDYDSFAKNGGSAWVDKAFNIKNVIPNPDAIAGWDDRDVRNRYWLIENLQSQQLAGVREGFYKYHRFALDNYLEKPQESKKIVLEVLRELEKANRLKTTSLLVNLFFDEKYQEIISIFKDAKQEDKQEAYNLCTRLDPARLSQYARIMTGSTNNGAGK
jgi:hypothetical protein